MGATAGDLCGQIATADHKKLLTRTYGINHWAGTCPLGKCVDAETLRVHGFKNVAVADASLLPYQVWGHPALTLTALALRSADLLASSLTPITPAPSPTSPPLPWQIKLVIFLAAIVVLGVLGLVYRHFRP